MVAAPNGILRLAPHSVEAEEAVIGGVLTDPEQYAVISAYLKPDDFHINRLALVWDAMGRIAKRHSAIDVLTVSEEIRVMGKGDQFEDKQRGFLVNLINRTPSSYNASEYGELVRRLAVRRRMLTTSDEFRKLAYDEQIPLETVIASAEKSWISVKQGAYSGDKDQSFSDIVGEVLDDVIKYMEAPELAMGVPTGFRDLDELTVGMHPGDLIIIAARPGTGKTSFMLSVALNAASNGFRIGFMSQEMNRKQIVQRLAAMETGINLQKIRFGRLDNAEFSRFVKTCGELSKLPIYVTDANGLTPARVRAKGLNWQSGDGLDLLIVDYLQIMSSGGMFKPNERVGEVGYFARELKQIARELQVPVYAAAQLSRAVETRGEKRPILADLRESGEIEQEADLVQFIYRDVMYNEATEFPNRAEIITAKHRNGATGTIDLHFERSTTKFADSKTMKIDLGAL